ncbi:VOC family protein [Halorarum salinum]|uniref:VOC family protein n=1 Tax=Halorarum salinum TaxID=2743089 RepID=A0A7D5LAD6_9EURY|nr:VOC family protein [Halobaculum salinum]QLG61750.1 VOC family protein [Halobaculum salinum]
MDVLHAALWVDDVEAMDEFYTEGLGLEFSREFEGSDGVRNYFLTGESDTEIQFKHDEGVDRESGPSSGFDHVAIAVEDVEDRVDRLVDAFGSEVVRGPDLLADKGIEIAFVTDPEGYVVELIERLEE